MATYYIDWDNGNDTTGSGTEAAPWKTFSKAHGEASGGDTIQVLAGSYAETWTFTKSLTCQAASGVTATIVPASGSRCVDINANSTTAVIDNIDIDGSNLDNVNSYGVFTDNAGAIYTLKNLTITGPSANANDYCVYLDGGSVSTLDNCTVTAPSGSTNAIKMTASSSGITLDTCTVSMAADASAIDCDSTGAVITIKSSTVKITTGSGTTYCLDAGDSQVIATFSEFLNASTGNTAGGIQCQLDETPTHFIANNTFDCPLCLSVSGAADNGKVTAKNNIFVVNNSNASSGAVSFARAGTETATQLDYNQYWIATGSGTSFYGKIAAGASTTFEAWKTATGQEANAVNGDPTFTDRANDDYTLGTGSTAINAGVDLGLGYVGSAPDIGANQVTSSANAGVGIYDFKQADGTQYPMYVASGTVNFFDRTPETWESGFTAIGSGFTANANSFWDFQTDSDTLWLFGASEALHKWDGSTNTTGTVTVTNGDATVTGSGTDFESPQLGADGKLHLSDTGEVLEISSVTDGTNLELTTTYSGATRAGVSFVAYTYQPAGGSPPAGKYIRVFNNYLFLAGNSTNTSRLYYSNLKDFETWGASDFIDINRQDGDPITALFLLGDYLYIGKEDTMWRLEFTGDANFPWVLNKVADVGVRSHWSVAGTTNVKFFLAEDGVYMIGVGTQPQKVSIPIESSDQLLGTNTSRWQYAQALYQPEEREYWLHVSGSGATQNNTFYIYDVAKQAWATWSGISMNCLGHVESTTNTWTPYGGDEYGDIFELDTGTNDDGSAIDMIVQSKAYDFGSSALEKQLRQAILNMSKDSAWSCTLSHRTDFNAWVDQTLLSTDDETSGSGFFKRRTQLTEDTVGHYFEIKIRNNQADKALAVYGWSLQPKGLGNR